MKTRKRRLIISVGLAIMGVFTLALMVSCNFGLSSQQLQTERLEEQRRQITSVLGASGLYSPYEVLLIEQTDSEENLIIVGELTPELDAVLKNVVDAFNADPKVSVSITLEEARYNLTKGIVEATLQGTEEIPFRVFLDWTGTRAVLVYKGYYRDTDGTEHYEGEPVVHRVITNFVFVVSRDADILKNYKFAFE